MRFAPVVAVMLLGSAAGLTAAHLYPETVAAWDRYVAATEARIARELESPHGFLALDFDANAASARHSVLAGEVVVEPMETVGVRGEELDVPSAMVHHWRGAV